MHLGQRQQPRQEIRVPGTMMIGFHCFPKRAQPHFHVTKEKEMDGASHFLWSLVETKNFMRLSLQKAAQATLGGATYRKSGSPRLFRPTYAGANVGTLRYSNPLRW